MTFKPNTLRRTELLIAIAVKILMGMVYGYLFLSFYNGDDTWKIHQASLDETKLLLNDPLQFFIREYTPVNAIEHGRNWAEITMFYINDLEYALVVKTIAIFNLLSQGNYYINVVLFNLIVFFGHYWLFVVLTGLFPDRRKILFYILFLFLPAVFWLSGIRGDALLFFFFSLTLSGIITEGKRSPWRMLALAGVIIIRPPFGLLMALAVIAYYIARKSRRPALAFCAVYMTATIIFFAAHGGKYIITKQQQFAALQGTRFKLDKAEPSVKSFLQIFPQALNNTFLRPYVWEAKGALQLLSAGETIVFWALLVYAFYNRRSNWKQVLFHPVILMLLCFSLSVYLFIGYIVPFPGAIVRYKIIPELVILACGSLIINNNNINYSSKRIAKS